MFGKRGAGQVHAAAAAFASPISLKSGSRSQEVPDALRFILRLLLCRKSKLISVLKGLPYLGKDTRQFIQDLSGRKTEGLNSTLATMDIISMCISEVVMESFPIYLYCQTRLGEIEIQRVIENCCDLIKNVYLVSPELLRHHMPESFLGRTSERFGLRRCPFREVIIEVRMEPPMSPTFVAEIFARSSLPERPESFLGGSYPAYCSAVLTQTHRCALPRDADVYSFLILY